MARNSKLGMAFVTFEDINHARTVMEDHDRNFIERCLALNKRAGESKLGHEATQLEGLVCHTAR